MFSTQKKNPGRLLGFEKSIPSSSFFKLFTFIAKEITKEKHKRERIREEQPWAPGRKRSVRLAKQARAGGLRVWG